MILFCLGVGKAKLKVFHFLGGLKFFGGNGRISSKDFKGPFWEKDEHILRKKQQQLFKIEGIGGNA